MNIAILNWRDLAHSNAGGAEVFVHEVGRRWVEEGHSVMLFSSCPRRMPSDDVHDGLRIRRIGKLRDGSHHFLAPKAALRDACAPDVLLESVNTIPYLLPVRRELTTPFATLVHQMARDVWRYHLPAPLARGAQWAEPHLYSPYRRRIIAAVSNSTKMDLEAAGVRDVRVLPQGGPGRQPLQIGKEKDPTFLFVGRLTANKRPDHVLEAFRLIRRGLPTARLWVIGDGRMLPGLAREAPLGVRFFGRVDRRELLERMERAHLLLVTSVREGWGLVVTEANALGTPAVAYDVSGLRDSIIHRVTGILTEHRPEALAEEAIFLFQHSEIYLRLRDAALERAAASSWSVTAATLLDFLIFSSSQGRAGVERHG
jgi:glycosyltransferase involved in cell wall biosynthesis